MRTLSTFLCLGLVFLGFYLQIFKGNTAGSAILLIGAFAFLIIAPKTKKIEGYDANHWMNK